jgi:uncharacterized membrane protein
MRTHIIAYWDCVRGSFWFLPLLLLVSALIAGTCLPILDDWADLESQEHWKWLATTGAAARATLAALAGALITVASVVFSVAMVTLSLTTSQFGPRLLRTFFNQNVVQFTMGLFLAASLYCLLILKSVRTIQGEQFVPHISVTVAIVLALTACGVFIYFIHRVAFSIQAQNVVMEAAHELDATVDRLYRSREQKSEAADDPLSTVDLPPESWVAIPSDLEGYLQGIATQTLVEIAERHGLLFRMLHKPGDFLFREQPLLSVHAADEDPPDADTLRSEVRPAFIVGAERTPRQDVECPILNLVEVAVRALSPGINDPRTALACINRLSASLARIAGRIPPQGVFRDDAGHARLILRRVPFSDALDTAFRQIRQYGRDSASVTIRLVECLAVIARAAFREEDRLAIRRHGDMLRRSAERNLPEENDRSDVEKRLEQLEAALRAHGSP